MAKQMVFDDEARQPLAAGVHKVAKATLLTIGTLAGVAAALVVLYFAAVILVVLLGLWVAVRVTSTAGRMIP